MTTTNPRDEVVRYVTDGGLETDLIFHHGLDLPEFAAFPLLESDDGRAMLRRYYRAYVEIARAAGAGLLLETPTWRANPEWGERVGYDAARLAWANREAVRLLADLREHETSGVTSVLVSGQIGPRGDGYAPEALQSPEEARRYHSAQIEAFAEAGADRVAALTMTHAGEAIGVVRAAGDHGLPVAISFTVETDGRLPDGSTLAEAIAAVDEAAAPEHFLINCAHPEHVLAGADAGEASWRDRVAGTRVNASLLSHAELDEATELDEGDLPRLVAAQARLTEALGGLSVLGGCCGTDARHVAALWGVSG